MAAAFDEVRAITHATALSRTKLTAAMRVARYSMLDALPGLALGILPLAYIAMSLMGLSP